MKSIVLLFLVFILVAGLLTGCTIIRGSGVLKTEEMDFSGFTSVEVGDAFDLDIVRSDQFSVSITADDNLFEYIQVSKHGSTLKIYVKPAVVFHSATHRVRITMPKLVNLELSGATHGVVSGFDSVEDRDIEVSGASSLNMDSMIAANVTFNISGASHVTAEINAGNVEFDVSGASTVRLRGTGDNIELNLSGASNARLDDFPVTDADVNLSGASRAEVNVDGKLEGNLSGASNLIYTGNPATIDVDSSGGSTIKSD